ncbi:type 1 glutamine amidotransferase [Rhodococcus sp. 5A-K4]|uniref:type 1 glutamine amidotransferase n=1 Tax=Rhodococcus sp. 5A-K4 TaxID=3384442 RepID=UPI001367B5E0|nr:type 1 glutamine amidotransferase [Rhodococcus erythropolis]
MSRILTVISHIDDPSIGILERSARSAGWTIAIVRPFRGEVLPSPEDLDALTVLGGPQSAYDTANHPYLNTEIDFIARTHRRGVPILAICLGSQLLSEALGGQAAPGTSGLECGFIHVTAATTELPLQGRFFSFHSDTAIPPAHAERLARSDRYLQSWRVGSSLAIQFHPELGAVGIGELLAIESEKLARFGVDVGAIRAELAEESTSPSPGDCLLDAWFAALPDSIPAHSLNSSL